jgi:hypothetical protein
MKYLLIIALLFATSAKADEWSTTDKVLETAYMATILVDWRQTQDIRNHAGYYEKMNGILGSHPSNTKINVYFVVATAAQYMIADALPEGYRTAWIGSGVLFELNVTSKNKSIGLKWNY